ncbi:exocyst complex component 6 [Trypanosoma conorhini]|uniref:Exocyst complex component 6 n=1 Tax=Trypanosoma conorhini TaxID=83891 RepID=A0A3R7M424_9TRYP|nr:exocyst complex component 6 [Trypanosoma conorhini]RNF08645.1 exocyst complex component 6 [Trypanosoma conorhini]
MEVGTDAEHNEKVQTILRDMGDSPHILYHTKEPLRLHRHGKLKKVFLVATPYHVYLIKAKGISFYARWQNRLLTVSSTQNTICIGAAGLSQVQQLQNSGQGVPAAVDEEDPEFATAKIECASVLEATDTERWLQKLAAGARLRAEQLENDESHPAPNAPQEAKEAEDEWSGADSEVSEDDAGPMWGQQQVLLQRPREGESNSLFQKAPSRYLAVASLVDGEFTDYTALKNAYLRNEEDILQEDLAAFVKENEGQVEKLCESHYPAFLHAARQCFSISEQDAELVGQELSGATTLTRSSVLEMKRSAADLNLSRCVKQNLAQVGSILRSTLELAEILETVETRVQKQQLLGAVVALKQLMRVAAPFAEYALGEYVIHHRVPQLSQDIFTAAVHDFNAWLKLLRDSSLPIGAAALKWEGAVQTGSVEKKLRVSDDGEWWVEMSYVRACIRRAPFTESSSISNILYGASIQEVFEELRHGMYYRNYYAESRTQQAKLDLYELSMFSEALSGELLVAELEKYCATALGFVLIEDIVHNITEPHVQSTTEIICMWEKLSQAMADRARHVSTLLVSDPNYTARMMDVFRLLRSSLGIVVDCVKSVRLSPLILSLVVESMSDSIISSWLQEACVEATQGVLTDTLSPLTATTPDEYHAYVTRFYLDRCKSIELPLPPSPDFTAGVVTLPYALMVPVIGEVALRFLSQCHSILVVDEGAVVRQSELNNVDEMLLKYLSVLFRTVAELLQGHLATVAERAVMQLAVYVTSCATMSVIVSCVEQQFVLAWHVAYDEGKRETLGAPRLLANSATLFAKAVQKGIERLLSAFTAETEDRLRPVANLDYWKRLVEVRCAAASTTASATATRASGKDDAEKGLPEAMEYVIAMIPKLTAVLQVSVVRSVLGTVVAHAAITTQANLGAAIRGGCRDGAASDFAALRDCVREFELLCAIQIPLWQKRIDTAISGISAAQRFPLQPKQIADELLLWIERKEAAAAAEQANTNQVLAGIEEAGKLVAKGVGKGIYAVGQTVKGGASAITGAASALAGKRET